MEGRWTRLERYAQWKQRRMRIDNLPPDVLALVCTFIEYTDVCHLIEAINGIAPQIRCPQDVQAIPIEIRRSWIHEAACDVLEKRVQSLANEACYFSRDLSWYVHVYADWTLFTSNRRCCRPLAKYFWKCTSGHPTWSTNVHKCAIRDCVRNMIRKSLCAVRLSMYIAMDMRESGIVLVPKELSSSCVLVIPHFIRFDDMEFSKKNPCLR